MTRFLPLFLRITFFSFCLICFLAINLFFLIVKDLPGYDELANYYPPLTTRIYTRDGRLLESYALENRIFASIKNTPRLICEAVIATEDKNFFNHPGIDIIGIARAVIKDVPKILTGKKLEGASTITQQVVRSFLLTNERTIIRKLKEAILAYRVSRIFSKSKILELYLNRSFFGRGSYGIVAASQSYFDKSIENLNIEEIAFLAGLLKAPSALNPEKNYQRALERRNYALRRMMEDGYISEQQAKRASQAPIKLKKTTPKDKINAHYFSEKVRSEAISILGKDYFYTAGLTIITTLDSKMQEEARRAFINGIRDFDRRKGFRGAITTINTEQWHNKLNNLPNYAGLLEYDLAVILDIKDHLITIGLKNGDTNKIEYEGFSWALKSKSQKMQNILKTGDVIAIEKIEDKYFLRQIPKLDGGLIVIEPSTGNILAFEGGYDFFQSKFDRVTQALRQPGSLIKPFVYLAALENGFEPNQIFLDAPIEIDQGPGMPKWKPKNYKGNFLGAITMQRALELSRNLVTVRIAKQLGINKIKEIVKRFGINNNPPNFYSMTLGSLETTLEKMAHAYTIIANYGQFVPLNSIVMIKDREGNVIYRKDNDLCQNCDLSKLNESELKKAAIPYIEKENTQELPITDKDNCYQLITMLQGVVKRGTATRANKLNINLSAKTGTTNESKDTWFIGFTDSFLIGTYLGYDKPASLGQRETGASVALPIAVNFLKNLDIKPANFTIPDNIKILRMNQQTGDILDINRQNNIEAAFKIKDMKKEIKKYSVLEILNNNYDDNSTNSEEENIQEYYESQEGEVNENLEEEQEIIDHSNEIY